jgi:hypothetical protein
VLTYLSIAGLAAMALAALVAALLARAPGVQLTGATVLVALGAVLSALSLLAGHYVAALVFFAAVAVIVHLTVAAAFHTTPDTTRDEAEEAVR